MKNNLYIPKMCKVGFNERSDTYTTKLGYIIYNDGKVWRKEPSWNSWRSNKPNCEPIEFENTPIEGFVLNKKVGGNNYSYNPRQTYTRVYDPRGWEFEITIPNLLYILENTNSIKGKGLEGKFLYSWDGKDLVLIPENAPEYESNLKFTDLQTKKISAKDLKVGRIYLTKKNEEYLYLGKFIEYTSNYNYNTRKYEDGEVMKHWFCPLGEYIETRSSLTFLAEDTGKDDFTKLGEMNEKMQSMLNFIGKDSNVLVEIENLRDFKRGYFYLKIGGEIFLNYYHNYRNSIIKNSYNKIIDLATDSEEQIPSYSKYTTSRVYTFPELEGKTIEEIHNIYPLFTKKIKLKNGKII